MKGITIYKSKNNGLGGEFDTTTANSIFQGSTENFVDSRYCCLYIKNNSLSRKKLLKSSLISIDSVFLGVAKNPNILVNKLADIGEPSDIMFEDQYIRLGVVLEPGDFINLWLTISDGSSTSLKKSVSVVVEWVDEY